MKIRLGVFVTHPIQYQAPLWRALAREPGLDLTVYYFSDQGVAERVDPGFGKAFLWDVPLLDGYRYEFLSRLPIHRANWFRIPSPRNFFRKRQLNVALLYGYTHYFARQVILYASNYGLKVILSGDFLDVGYSVRNTKFYKVTAPGKRVARAIYLKWFYRRVDHFCPVGTEALKHLLRRKIPKERITLAPRSVDDQLIRRQMAKYVRQTCRKELEIEDTEFVFLFSGKLIPRKQPLLLGRAVEILGRDFEPVLIFIGDGIQREQLRANLVTKLGRRFIAPGFVNQSEIGRYFRAADVFVLPSRHESWGLAVNEAMHFGLPCIVSDRVPCAADLIIPGETGYVFDHASAKELARYMRRFLDNPGLAKEMGKRASEHIEGFTIAKTAAGLIQAVHKALSL